MALHNELGEMGENIASNFLINKGFKLIERNHNRKWGEIDIILHKDNRLHFVEVKTVKRQSVNGFFEQPMTNTLSKSKNEIRPEENMHIHKVKRLKRVIETYLLENKHKWGSEVVWQFDLVCVYADPDKKVAKVSIMQNLIL